MEPNYKVNYHSSRITFYQFLLCTETIFDLNLRRASVMTEIFFGLHSKLPMSLPLTTYNSIYLQILEGILVVVFIKLFR